MKPIYRSYFSLKLEKIKIIYLNKINHLKFSEYVFVIVVKKYFGRK